MFIVRGRAARDKRLNCPQSAELTSHVESVRPLSDEKILIGGGTLHLFIQVFSDPKMGESPKAVKSVIKTPKSPNIGARAG